MNDQTRYRKLELLGSGGMGEVWLVHDEQLGCYWAMKLLKKDSDADSRAAFERETAILTALHHHGIPRIVDRIHDAGQVGVIMDLVEGVALSEYREMCDETTLLHWAKQLLDILKHIHSQQILYLDLKPENIMLDRNHDLHLIDFGIACFKKEQDLSLQRYGTIGYSPKEQYETTLLDERCDIYAFGKTMLALASGASGKALASMKTDNTSLSQGFRLLLDGCIHEDKEYRYDHVDEVLRDLEKLNRLHTEIHIRKKRRKCIRACLYGLGTFCFISALCCQVIDYQIRLHRYETAMLQADYQTAIAQQLKKSLPYQRLYEEIYNEQLKQAKTEASLVSAIAQARSYSVKRMQEYQLDLAICDDEFLSRMIQDALLSGDEALRDYAYRAALSLQDQNRYRLLIKLCIATAEKKPFAESEQIIAEWLKQEQNQQHFTEWGFLYAQLYELHALELDEAAYLRWQALMKRLYDIRSVLDVDWLNEDMTRLLYLMQADSYYQYGRYMKNQGNANFHAAFEKLFALNDAMKHDGYCEAQILSQCGNACLYLFTEGDETMKLHWLKQSQQYFETALSINKHDTAASKGLADCKRFMKYWGYL